MQADPVVERYVYVRGISKVRWHLLKHINFVVYMLCKPAKDAIVSADLTEL